MIENQNETICAFPLHRDEAQRKRVRLEKEKESERNGCSTLEERRTEWSADCFDVGQAIKSARGMPWHQEPMKDVTSCEKLRGAANER